MYMYITSMDHLLLCTSINMYIVHRWSVLVRVESGEGKGISCVETSHKITIYMYYSHIEQTTKRSTQFRE